MSKEFLFLLAATMMTACSTCKQEITNNPYCLFIQDVRGEND